MTTPFSVRPYRDADRAAIVPWLAASEPWVTLRYSADDWRRYFHALAGDEDRDAHVIESDGAPVGLAVIRPRVLLGDYLELFAIAPAARRLGAGRALIAHVERRAFDRSNNLYVCVSDFNEAARAFYRASGYQDVGVLGDLLVEGRAEILLRKTIGPVRRGA